MKPVILNLPAELSAILITLICGLPAANVCAADTLGRLFTTPEQRNTLETLRQKEPEVVVQPEIILIEEDPEIADTRPDIGGITLNGLVYRKNGKSTAWVNNANTFEGNLGNQYIQIDARNIDPDNVVIQIPVTETTVKLKAGETYTPETEVSNPGILKEEHSNTGVPGSQ